jgi:hypothetical protein
MSAVRLRGHLGLRVWEGLSIGGANVLVESLKALVIVNPLALSVVRPECKIPSSIGNKDAEDIAELSMV